MGYDITLFEGEVDEDLRCSICSGVLEEPLFSPKCEHTFCKSCINEWLKIRRSCPIDRQRMTTKELIPVPRSMRNLISRLIIKCDNAHLGCTAVVQLERLEAHKEDCEHNPKRPVPCEQGCGLAVLKGELKDHNCVREVRLLLQTQQERANEDHNCVKEVRLLLQTQQDRVNEMQCTINEMQHGFNEMRREIVSIKSSMQEYIHAVRLSNPSIAAPLEVDDTIRWSNSLQKARGTQWEFMCHNYKISSPCLDDALTRSVRGALDASGCPAHTTAKLMESVDERGWPAGLRTIAIQHGNQQLLKNYVCRIIPGVQAVVVMAVDNAHMNDDMIQEPGHVMIFSCGMDSSI